MLGVTFENMKYIILIIWWTCQMFSSITEKGLVTAIQ